MVVFYNHEIENKVQLIKMLDVDNMLRHSFIDVFVRNELPKILNEH